MIRARQVTKRWLIGSNPRRTLLRMAVLSGLTVLVFRFGLLPLKLEGESMAPTYTSGGVNLANRLSYVFSEPERGDVVAVRLRDSGRRVFLLKRIVGLPGERIAFQGGRLLVNGQPQIEPYLSYSSDWNSAEVLCEADEYFVVGDNRSMPIEQHTLGRARLSRIVGKVLF